MPPLVRQLFHVHVLGDLLTLRIDRRCQKSTLFSLGWQIINVNPSSGLINDAHSSYELSKFVLVSAISLRDTIFTAVPYTIQSREPPTPILFLVPSVDTLRSLSQS